VNRTELIHMASCRHVLRLFILLTHLETITTKMQSR
jgi:hypothetical protein